MHIVSVELTDIKRYESAAYTFTLGTNAISGPNGSGKSTILEAIGYALFDTLPYKKEDFLRKGAKVGTVRVTFESSLDGRAYTVVRNTRASYYVYDPQTKTKLAEQKLDVLAWLRLHLGVEPDTDLEELFRTAIGVPQGTFTAIFAETAVRRKAVFDRVLRVEEYRKSSDALKETAALLHSQVGEVDVKMAGFHGQLLRLPDLERQREQLELQLGDASRKLAGSRSELALWQARLTETDALLERLQAEEQALRLTDLQLEAAGKEHAAQMARLAEARSAGEESAKVTPDHEAFQEAEAALKRLSEDRLQRDGLAKRQLEALREQSALAAAIQSLDAQLELLDKEAEQRLKHLREGLAREQVQRVELERLIARKEALKPLASTEPLIREQGQALSDQVSRLEGALERDRKAQSEFKGNACPILLVGCPVLEGQSAVDYFAAQNAEREREIAERTRERDALRKRYLEVKAAEREVAGLSELERQREQLAQSQRAAEAKIREIEALRQHRIDPSEVVTAREEVETLERRARFERERAERARTEAAIQERLRALDGELEPFADLDARWRGVTAAKEAAEPGYRRFLTLAATVAELPAREVALAAAQARLDLLHEERRKQAKAHDATRLAYRQEDHQELRDRVAARAAETIRLEQNVVFLEQQRATTDAEMAELRRLQVELAETLQERERLAGLAAFVEFARLTLKEAGPFITEAYLLNISLEADRLYRDITGNAHVHLRWSSDYEILLEENGRERPFASLSGGEQMAAALSVRLALLKEMSAIDLAFFDEPTTNMDENRRQNLAFSIGALKGFAQLVVISHDDTFEQWTDHVVRVGAVAASGGVLS
jgi:exonuclease SbcC